jgi:thioredoxin reductase (NADPH)
MIAQLNAVFARMESPLILRLSLDGRAVSAELQAYIEELVGLTNKRSLELAESPAGEHLPKVEVLRADGSETGLAFHGVPGGHEFTSFVLGLYNAAGPGQPIDDADRAAIAAVRGPLKLQVLVRFG